MVGRSIKFKVNKMKKLTPLQESGLRKIVATIKESDYNFDVIPHTKLKGRAVFNYDDLSDTSKLKARNSVIISLTSAYKHILKSAKEEFGRDMHAAINDKYHGSRINNARTTLKKAINSRSYLEKFIKSNLINFLEDGTYIKYNTE